MAAPGPNVWASTSKAPSSIQLLQKVKLPLFENPIQPATKDYPVRTEGGSMSSIRHRCLLLLAVMPTLATGCFPFGLGFGTPVPIEPWVSERMEQKYNNKNDNRAPI